MPEQPAPMSAKDIFLGLLETASPTPVPTPEQTRGYRERLAAKARERAALVAKRGQLEAAQPVTPTPEPELTLKAPGTFDVLSEGMAGKPNPTMEASRKALAEARMFRQAMGTKSGGYISGQHREAMTPAEMAEYRRRFEGAP